MFKVDDKVVVKDTEELRNCGLTEVTELIGKEGVVELVEDEFPEGPEIYVLEGHPEVYFYEYDLEKVGEERKQ